MSSPPRHDAPAPDRKPVTLMKLAEKRALGEPIVMVTAYDHPSAVVAEQAGVDMVLVGDSAANNVLGYSDTVPVTVEELLMLAAAVHRGLKTPLLVGDLPFGSYEASDAQAIAHRAPLRQGGRLRRRQARGRRRDGRARARDRARRRAGDGPRRADAADRDRARRLPRPGPHRRARRRRCCEDALALQEAGCFAIVFEAIPSDVTDVLMHYMEIPVIGIGAGASTDGQVLVLHDLLAIHEGFKPKFVKQYAAIGAEMVRGVTAYAEEVRNRAFPGPGALLRDRPGGARAAARPRSSSPRSTV